VGLSGGAAVKEEMKIATIVLQLRVKNNNKNPRGKKRAIESIERHVLAPCHAMRRDSGEYELKIPYYTDQGLDKIVDDLLGEIHEEAYLEKCFSESEARLEGTNRQW
jgi:hypothetical protein